ncbi:MAG: sugar-binding domain-containing protein, partial [Brachybacterium sp.]|nr:sugar-binding domain-containing protein [Brachybacterium sp.]
IRTLWREARAVVVGVGAPFRGRKSIASVVPSGDAGLMGAVGDICLHFYDADGRPIEFEGSERLIRPERALLEQIESSIAVAAGLEKAPSLIAGAKAGLFRTLITDTGTAAAVLDLLETS